MNVHSTGVRRHPILLVILGVSGAGKSTLLRYLEDTFLVESAPKYTTRPKRSAEVDRDFLFVSQEDLPRDKLLIFQSYSHDFGIQIAEIDLSLQRGSSHAVVVGDQETAARLVERYENVVVILAYCDPETLRHRIVGDAASPRSERWATVEREIGCIYRQLGYVDVVIDCSGSVREAHAQMDELADWFGLRLSPEPLEAGGLAR